MDDHDQHGDSPPPDPDDQDADFVVGSWAMTPDTTDHEAAQPGPPERHGRAGDQMPEMAELPKWLRQILAAVDVQLREHGEQIAVDAAGLVEHAGRLDAMGQQLADLTAPKEKPKTPHLQRFRYERVEPKVAAAAQNELAAWVPWLVTVYRLEDLIPPCWPRHDALFEELAGLYLSWVGAWSTDNDLSGPLVWHERLDRFRSRPPTWARGVLCHEQACGLDTTDNTQRLDRWLLSNANTHDGTTVDQYRLTRARLVLPAPIPAAPPKADKPNNPTSAGGAAPAHP